jgi:hypothetical protein
VLVSHFINFCGWTFSDLMFRKPGRPKGSKDRPRPPGAPKRGRPSKIAQVDAENIEENDFQGKFYYQHDFRTSIDSQHTLKMMPTMNMTWLKNIQQITGRNWI